MQLAAPVTTDGEQCEVVDRGGSVQAPGADEDRVDEPCPVADQGIDGFVGIESPPQVRVTGGNRGAELGR